MRLGIGVGTDLEAEDRQKWLFHFGTTGGGRNWVERGYPPPRVFWKKSLEMIENKGQRRGKKGTQRALRSEHRDQGGVELRAMRMIVKIKRLEGGAIRNVLILKGRGDSPRRARRFGRGEEWSRWEAIFTTYDSTEVNGCQ